MKKQIWIQGKNIERQIEECLSQCNANRIFVVGGTTYQKSKLKGFFEHLPYSVTVFCDFSANPSYESVKAGVKLFSDRKCDLIAAVGGGSAIDVAKCIKLFSTMNPDENYLTQDKKDSRIPLMAVPTTAGTGSESTKYAVIYDKGEKQSVADESILPDFVVFEPELLKTLPDYQRKTTMMDALCHSVESFWSVNSTEESKILSLKALKMILQYKDAYLSNTDEGNEKMLLASNLAGQAIHITQTTAVHAMCYKITSLYGISHGHAAALCLPAVWNYMLENTALCADIRGEKYLKSILRRLAEAMGSVSLENSVVKVKRMIDSLGLEYPALKDIAELEVLADSVNPIRLKNHPVLMEREAFIKLYQEILS